MFRILKTRIARLTAASLAALMVVAPIAPLVPITTASAAAAAVSPAVDWSFGAPTPNADPDPFYTPPSPLPTGNPGDIIRARPSLAGPPTARSLANAWQVMYLSTDVNGNPDAVTGTILVPKGVDPTKAPVVGFAPGTTGPAFRCTVSRFINSGSFYEQAALNQMLQAGYAVAITDYEGYHQDPKSTYIVKSMGNSVLDAVRAATRLPQDGLSANPKVLVRGFSQGGGAAMWAGQEQPSYAPELNLIGVAGGGVPADPIQVLLGLQRSAAFGFAITAIQGFSNAYPNLTLDANLNSLGQTTFANSQANDCTIELLTGYSGHGVSDYFTTSPFVQHVWIDTAQANALGNSPINVPVFDYHATNDPIVPYAQALNLRNEYCKLGMTVQWQTFDTGHITTVARGNADVMAFMAARLAGQAPVNNCDSTS